MIAPEPYSAYKIATKGIISNINAAITSYRVPTELTIEAIGEVTLIVEQGGK